MEPDEAIPTGDDNSIATAPPAQQEAPAPQGDSGAVGAQAIPTGDDNSLPEGPVNPQQGQTKRFGPLARIASYLMGEGAVPPQVLQQAADQIDPEAGMSASDRNLMVIEDANKRGGPEAAWKMMQANRVAYNAKQAFAATALKGTPQKPPDLHAAVDAANQAADHVLDGSNAHFMVSTGGQITATVKGPDGGPAQVFDLTPEQFSEYLNVGGAGQWDRQMQPGGVARTISTLPGYAPDPAGAGKVNLSGDKPSRPVRADGDNAPNRGRYSPDLEARSNRMFQGVSQERARQQWMADQEQNENKLQNAVDVAAETGKNRLKVARATGASRVETQESKNAGNLAQQKEKTVGFKYASDSKVRAKQIEADQKAAHDGNVDARARIETARKAIATKRMTAGDLSPEDKALEQQLTQQASQPQQQAPQQQAPAQQQAPQQQGAVPPPAQRVVNQVYNTPKGPHRWMGNGWQPVQ